MTRYLSLILCLCLYSVAGYATTRAWDEGPLVATDFTGTPALQSADSHIATDIILTTEPAGTGVFVQQARAVMYPERSWLTATADERGLRYMQAEYDLAEVMARRLCQELGQGICGIEADRRLTYYRDLLSDELHDLEAQTVGGSEEASLQTWEWEIRRALEKTASSPARTIQRGAWSYGFDIGMGAIFPGSDINDAFSGAAIFSFGLTGGWHGLHLHGTIGYGSPTIRDAALVTPEYADQGFMANVNNANLLAIGFALGYQIPVGKHFSIEPWCGAQWTGYNWTARPMVPDDEGGYITTGMQHRMQVDDFAPAVGMHLEWHFHQAVTNFPIFGAMKEQYVSSLRLTPYAIRAKYTDAIRHYSGWQIGFTISYSGLARALRLL